MTPRFRATLQGDELCAALGFGDGAEIRTPMAVAVICGLLTSTILTLLVIPTIYYLFGLAGERFFKAEEE